MGTNFYLKSKNPRPVYDKYHIAKTSCGWKPLFQADPEPEDATPWEEMPEPLPLRSLDDLKRQYDTGKFIIVDEYGDEYGWDDFVERVVDWNKDSEDALVHDSGYDYRVTTDPQGYQFAEYEFS